MRYTITYYMLKSLCAARQASGFGVFAWADGQQYEGARPDDIDKTKQ